MDDSILQSANRQMRSASIADEVRPVNGSRIYDPAVMEVLNMLLMREPVPYLKKNRVKHIFQYLLNSELDNYITEDEIRTYTNMGNEWIGTDRALDQDIREAQSRMQAVLARMQHSPAPAPASPSSPEHVPERRRRVLDTEFFDVISRNNVNIDNFLHNNEYPDNKPFIVSHSREFASNYVLPTKEIFYECAPGATQDQPNKSRNSKTFIKLTGAGGSTILCIKPKWFDNPDYTPKIVRAVRMGRVAQIISKTSQDRPQGARRLIGADHCNLEAPLDYYKLVPYTQKSKKKGRTKRVRGTKSARIEARNAEYINQNNMISPNSG